MTVRTRFAPSPTGYLHIGGVRTALFNWLLARRHGGQFLLRIDDTDQARHVEEAVELILNGFRWLGMNWDEGPDIGGPHAPYYQSQRGPKYEAAIVALLEAGCAYPCLASPKEVELARAAAVAAKQPFVYRGPTRTMPPNEALAIFRERRPAIRFKVPENETVLIHDHVRGDVEVPTNSLGDFTICREGAGSSPLYNLASIVDDIDMQITHIVRAEEHLSNTPPQILIAKGLGAKLPEFAHVPYVAAPGGKKKLSKRNPPPGVMVALDEYEKAGYLPEAMMNALGRLGWSLDDKSEIIPRDVMIANFSLDRVTKAPASLDKDKIYWIQDQYMRQLPAEERVHRMLPFLQAEGLISSPATTDEQMTVRRIDAACGDRLKLLSDIVRYGGFFFRERLVYEEKAAKTLGAPGVPEALDRLHLALSPVDPFTAANAESAVKTVADALGLGGKINHIVRAATTGQTVGPGVYECLEILGRKRSLERIMETKAAIEAGDLRST